MKAPEPSWPPAAQARPVTDSRAGSEAAARWPERPGRLVTAYCGLLRLVVAAQGRSVALGGDFHPRQGGATRRNRAQQGATRRNKAQQAVEDREASLPAWEVGPCGKWGRARGKWGHRPGSSDAPTDNNTAPPDNTAPPTEPSPIAPMGGLLSLSPIISDE